MDRRSRSAGLILLVGMLVSSQAQAWTPETRIELVHSVIRMMPGSLRLALERHQEAVLRGMLEPMLQEDDPDHRPPWDDGTLEAQFHQEVEVLQTLLRRSAPFQSVARQFGRVAHFVSDTGFPPAMSGASGEGHYAHFASFCESRRPRFRTVFGGHDDPLLADGKHREWALDRMNRARDEDATLAGVYDRAGTPPHPSAFDDRSVPFAIGALSWSRTVTDVTRVWLSIWDSAGGDMSDTPYRKTVSGGE